jgi:hypothetical protein
MILYLKDPKDSKQKNLLDLTNNFGNVAAYQIDIQKSADILYTKNKQAEKKIRQIPLTIIIKYQHNKIPS